VHDDEMLSYGGSLKEVAYNMAIRLFGVRVTVYFA